MLRPIISVFLFWTVSVWGSVSVDKKVVAAVFHQSYCDGIPQAIDNYREIVEKADYQLLKICTGTKSVVEIKKQIQLAADKEGSHYGKIEGVNLFGPVISTRVDRSLRGVQRGVMFATAELAFDDLSFTYEDDILKDVSAGYFMPDKMRWVSHQLPQTELQMDEMVKLLQLDSKSITGEVGRNFSRKVLERIWSFRPALSDTLLTWPTGIVWNVALPGVTYVLWRIGGWSRRRASTEEVPLKDGLNRFQTRGDLPGYVFTYSLIAAIAALSGYWLYWNIQDLRDTDPRWKKMLFLGMLGKDGLLEK